MYKIARRGSLRFIVESLEGRALLSGSNAIHIDVGSVPSPFNLFSNVIASGTQISVSGDAFASSSAVKATTTPAGSFVFQWYGGNVIGSFPLRQDNTNHIALLDSTPLTLDVKDVGPAITGGPYQGDFLLGYSFTGDDNFGPTPILNGTDFASVASPYFNGVISGFIVKLNGANVETQLSFLHEPDDTAVNGVINPAVTVQILDKNSVPVITATDPVTLTLTGGDSTATLLGTTTVNAVGGVATFSDLAVDKPGKYQLIASSGTFDSVYSSSFSIAEGKFAFITPPKSGDAGAAITPAIVVALQDDNGNTITSDSSTVVTLTPVGFNGDAPITGNVATLVNGIATFNQVVLKKAGFYQLQASDGVHAVATTGKFKIGGDKIVISKQPADVNVNGNFPLTISIVNSKGKLDTNATTTALLSLNPLAAGSIAQLGGNISVPFVGGLAVFTADAGPTIDTPGKYTLTVTEVQLDLSSNALIPTNTTTPVTSKAFSVGNYQLVFVKPPKAANVGESLDFAVAQQDLKHKTNTKLNSHHVQLTLTPVKDGVDGALSDFTNIGFIAGVQTFSGGQSPSIDTPGTYSLTATEVDGSGAAVATTKPGSFARLIVTGFHLVFRLQPVTSSITRPIPVAVEIQDSKGRVSTTFDGAQCSLSVNPSTAGTSSDVPTFADAKAEGVVTTSSGTKPGTYTITASAQNGIAAIKAIQPATSKSFKLANEHLAFVNRPGNASKGQTIPFSVAIEDVNGKIDTNKNGVSLKLTSQDAAQFSYNAVPFSSGEIAFGDASSSASARMDGALGRYTITANAVDDSGNNIPIIDPATSNPFKLLPLHVFFISQPQSIGGGFPIPAFSVGFADTNGKQITSATATLNLEVSFKSVSHGGDSGVLADVSTVDGVAQLSLLHIDAPGTYVITVSAADVTDGSVLSAVSVPFKILG